MSVSIPQPFRTKLSGSMGSIGPVILSGVPDTYHFNMDNIAKLTIGVDPIEVKPVTLEIRPMDVSFRWKEIPQVRTHIPAHYTYSWSLFGQEFYALRICGESQVITEPYQPNPCENCGSMTVRPPLDVPSRATHVVVAENSREHTP